MLATDMKECTGCSICALNCPKKCISIIENQEGFIYPSVDKSKCINCDACNRVCPQQYNEKNNYKKEVFALQSLDASLIQKCASGGAFASIAKEIINKGGYVCGVTYKNLKAEFKIITSEEELSSLLGSKYVQCNISREVIKQIKEIVKNNVIVFSGTPCQVSAIKRIIPKNFWKNLITIEILCQGVPSEKLVKYYYKSLEKKYHSKITEHYFRSKDQYVGKNYLNKYIFQNKNILYKTGGEDRLCLMFQRQNFLRESCYTCKYANPNRLSDFTIGDLWKYTLDNPKFDFEKGVSVVICNSPKASELIRNIGDIVIEIIDEEKALKNNIPYNHPVKRPNFRNIGYFLVNRNISTGVISFIGGWKFYLKKFFKGRK